MNYKKLIMGILLLVQLPAANANSEMTLYTSNQNKGINYNQCSIKLLDDNNVEIYFQTQGLSFMDGSGLAPVGAAYALKENGIKVDGDYFGKKLIKISPNRVFLSFYFYHADGTRDSTIQLNEISNISLNGIIPSGSKENAQEIQFDNQSLSLSNNYNVSFKISANKLNNISIAATVGGEFSYKEQSYSVLSSKGVSFSPDGTQCRDFDPQADIAPEALKIDPKFRMDSAVWQLKTLDLDELLDNTANNRGLPTQIIDAAKNRFCLNYRAIATRNNSYMISATNINGLALNNQHFQLKEPEGNNFINYKVELRSYENSGADFELPKDKKYIQLKNDNNQVMSDMCWEPNITLFSTDTTGKGSYSDTLNFTITPLA
ncbi:hypothetical protein [Yersinia artesiana]|uniref:hypothetical protein n=1 Tax=Yersinia artesiana TaxID=2890315 RepID=UPI001D0F9070|nr:hypothetical protein [Yersinia artesiana]